MRHKLKKTVGAEGHGALHAERRIIYCHDKQMRPDCKLRSTVSYDDDDDDDDHNNKNNGTKVCAQDGMKTVTTAAGGVHFGMCEFAPNRHV